MSDGTDDVLEAVADRIEQRLGRPLFELQQVAVDQPPETTVARVVRWYTDLVGAQGVVERRTEELADLLGDGDTPGLLSGEQMAAARAVDAAVTLRDARAAVLLPLLNQPTTTGHTTTPAPAAQAVHRPAPVRAGSAVRQAPVGAVRGARR